MKYIKLYKILGAFKIDKNAIYKILVKEKIQHFLYISVSKIKKYIGI